LVLERLTDTHWVDRFSAVSSRHFGRRKRMKKLLFLFALMLLLCAVAASADDLFPPPWRGQPGSTWQLWEFSTPDPNPMPDAGYNPYGVPYVQIYPGVGQVYWPELNGRVGVWPLSGEAWIEIPNRPEPLPFKDIYIQLTWEEQAPGNRPMVGTTAPQGVEGTLLQEIPLEGLWKHSIYTIRLQPNPDRETILITGGVDVDQLVIDTICYVPEPGSILALAGGLVGLVGFARRRRI
jgi:hypothetical protein